MGEKNNLKNYCIAEELILAPTKGAKEQTIKRVTEEYNLKHKNFY